MHIYFFSVMNGYETAIMTHEKEYTEKEFESILSSLPEPPNAYKVSNLLWIVKCLKSKGFKEPPYIICEDGQWISKIEGCD